MPFRPDPFLARFEPLRRLRKSQPLIGFGIAVAGVAAATVLRLEIGGVPAPFITFYPVVIVCALIGGFWAGMLSVVLSAVAAEIFILQPELRFALPAVDATMLVLYMFVASLLVVIVTLLNEAVDRLWRQSDNVRIVLESEPAGVIAVDGSGHIVLVNSMAEKLFGYARDELYRLPVETLVPDAARHGHADLRNRFLAAPSPRPMGAGRDLFGRRKDGSLVPIEVGLSPISRDGATGALATIVDISERKAAERRQQILLNELRHRGRNIMMLVQAIAMRTIPLESRKEFLSSIEAFARTQDLFLEAGRVDLARIIERELAPFRAQIDLIGGDVPLTERAAQDFALIVHELATNSVKHGALSTPDGRVRIMIAPDGGALAFSWEERGGPPVAPPDRTGFGQTILKDVAKAFCDEAEARYDPSGFSYRLRVRLDRITAEVIDLAERRDAHQPSTA